MGERALAPRVDPVIPVMNTRFLREAWWLRDRSNLLIVRNSFSSLKLFTGFAIAAITALYSTVIQAITIDRVMANTKTPQPMRI